MNRSTILLWLRFVTAAWMVLGLFAAQAQTFAQLQFDIIGVRLTADPTALTVPKNIPTIVNTELTLPAGAGPKARAALDRLRSETRVRAQLRGPSLPAIDIEVRPGDPIPIPPLALPGDYVLDQIRLVKGGEVLLDGTPGLVPIKVISEILVTSVTSRPLALAEIREKGIVIDASNFDLREFQLALNVDGREFKIRMPVALPSRELLAFQQQTPAQAVALLKRVNGELSQRQVVELPDDFDRPGLNFSIAAIPFMEAGADDGGTRPFGSPPITGLVVIPGNIAFLNQFFSVMLTVANVAPDGSLLSVRDLTAEITLPYGDDRVSGTFEQPGDDPLRLARIEGIGVQPVIDVVQPGPDGALGTTDDSGAIPPQHQGEGEFLVEGLREGFHTVDIKLSGMLEGLPSGPVEIQGEAIGAVLVRDPTFDLTLAHPRTIRSGEPYDLYATITNTSTTVANLVTVNLDERGVSGAVLDPNTEATVIIDTLLPGDSFTQKFTLVAQKTGQVTAASFNSEPGVTGRFQITTAVGERGVPLSPNSIVLPGTTRFLPDELVGAALRVLGQAYSIATSPSGALPAEVAFVRRQTVIERGRDLGQAGQRVAFGEPLVDVLQDLLLEWLGDGNPDSGFDQLMRQSNAGAALMEQFGMQFEAGIVASGAIDFLDSVARQTVMRDGHLTAIYGQNNGPAAVELRILDAGGNVAGPGPDGDDMTLPYADIVPIRSPGGERADLALVSRLDASEYRVELTGTGSGAFDLGIGVPAQAGEITLLNYSGVTLEFGGTARVLIRLGQTNDFDLLVDSDGDGFTDARIPATEVSVTETPPQVLAVRQLESYNLALPGNIFDPATYGLLVGILFDKPVTEATATETGNFTIESNSALGAVLQPGGRLVYLYLERPIGTLIERGIQVSGVTDERGNLLSPDSLIIETVLSDGAHVFGQLRTAAGEPVPDALIDLTIVISHEFAFDVSRVHTDNEGNFDFDFVRRIGRYFVLKGQHPETLDFTSLTAKVQAPGQELLLFPTFRGKGSVRGRVTDAADLPVAGAPVKLSTSQIPRGGLAANADALGEYIIDDVPVGNYTVRSFDGTGAFGLASGVVESAGEQAISDIQLILKTTGLGNLTGRVFLADGVTPGVGFSVYVGSYDRRSDSVSAVDNTESDGAGAFGFENLEPGLYDVAALDPTGAQLGVASNVSVIAGITASTVVVLEENGAVEGVIYNAQGIPVEGALVAGGVSLGVTDINGIFRIEGVPPGRRTIQAGNPLTKRRGSQVVTVLSNQTVNVAITLEARATIQGTVRDVNGTPVPRATVRIVRSGGFEFVFANDRGEFRFPDRPLGSYLLQAPGPGQAGLIEYMKKRGIPVCSAFTAIPPDPPPDFSCQTQAPNYSNENAALAAYQNALETVFNISETHLAGPPAADLSGGFGWTRVDLFQDSITVFADIDYLPLGKISGKTLAGNGLPTVASTRVSALGVAENGAAKFGELGRLITDLTTGEFAFGGIVLFDLDTFQNTGIRSGGFKLEAASTLEPGRPAFSGELNVNTPNWDDIILQFPLAAEISGTISGVVLLPDGTTPAPANVDVTIDYGDGIRVRTDAEGYFESSFPIPQSAYTATAFDPVSGLTGQARLQVLAGENTDIEIRLLGLGDTRIVIKRLDGSLVPDTNVEFKRFGFPGDELDGITDGSGEVQFFNVTEGKFGIMAEEQGTGLKGRASGTIVRDSEVTLVLTLQGAGTVTGTYLAADSITPVANANVVLNARGVQAYGNTDAVGRFFIDAVPVGPFSVEASDPLTGQFGKAGGELFAQGGLVDITIIQSGRGSVEGFVTQADGATPVAGARVSLAGSGAAAKLQSTTRIDGSFHFEGITVGDFFLTATDISTGFSGDAAGTIDFTDDLVVQNIVLEGFGAVRAQVLGSDGNPVDNVEVTLSRAGASRTAAVDSNGEFTFEFLRLGDYKLQARSLADPHNGGTGEAVIEYPGETATATLRLRGIGDVTVTVVNADGDPEPSARATLRASARLSGEVTSGPFGGSFTAFTDASGQAYFPGVPVGAFFVNAESGPVAGVSTGVIDTPNQSVPISVELGATGSVRGRLLLPDGFTAAADSFVTLYFQSQSSLQSGILQITTDLTGEFEFPGIPLKQVTLEAFEPVSAGVRRVTGVLTATSPDLDFGDLVLDNSAPRVLTAVPRDGEIGVAVDSSVEVVFNEPMQGNSFGSMRLMEGGIQVPGSVKLFNGDTRAVFTPTEALPSDRMVTLTIDGALAGPRDLVGLQLLDPFVSTFRTTDIIPPVITSTSPHTGETGVVPNEVARLTFSESIRHTIDLSLVDDRGQVVPGQVALSLGDTVAIFTPDDFLPPNGSYTLVADNVQDLAGNTLENSPFSVHFRTIDTLAPILDFLALQGVPTRIEGTGVTVLPVLTDEDVARLEYVVDGRIPWVVDTAPFSMDLTLTQGVQRVEITATAVDHNGNRSAPGLLDIEVLPNLPPAVSLVSLSCGDAVGAGETCSFRVSANDDLELGLISFSVIGALNDSQTETPAPSQTQFTADFEITIPSSAPSGETLTVQAVATDSLDQVSPTARSFLSIEDRIKPQVAIDSPVNQARVIPGASVDVQVSAHDDLAVTSLILNCTPALAECTTRTLNPPRATAAEVFTLNIPGTFEAPGTVQLSAVAYDAAGNPSGSVVRLLQIADTVPPEVVSLATLSGATRVLQNQVVVLRTAASDNVDVFGVEYRITGDGIDIGPSLIPADSPGEHAIADLSFTVPLVPNGSAIQVVSVAVDGTGNRSTDQILTLDVGDLQPPETTILEPQPGTAIDTGAHITLVVMAEDDVAVQEVHYYLSGVRDDLQGVTLITDPSTPVEVSFNILIPAATPPGELVFNTTAIDTAGNTSATRSVSVNVVDALPPTVVIDSPAAGSDHDPRNSLAVVINAADNAGIREIAFSADGGATASETRTISPVEVAVSETFNLDFVAPLPTGGSVILNATAHDLGGNLANALPAIVNILDVVAPQVVEVTPADGATEVDPATSVGISFSEPIDPASVTAASVTLTNGGPVPASLAFSADNSLVTLTPTDGALQSGTNFSITVLTTVTDAADNGLTATFTSGFTTVSQDDTPPQVATTSPVDGATGVSITSPIQVIFSEPVEPASVDDMTIQVSAGGNPVAGTLNLRSGNTLVHFQPEQPLPLDTQVILNLVDDIRDPAGNQLVGLLTFSFTTGAFSIAVPADGQTVPELNKILLEARASASLGIATVLFTVNGVELEPVAGPPFVAPFTTPAAAAVPVLNITASARNSGGVEIVQDAVTVHPGVDFSVAPQLLGIPLGGAGDLSLSVSTALAEDLSIELKTLDPLVAGVPAVPVVLPAGLLAVQVPVSGLTGGSTSVLANTLLGTEAAVISVSTPVSGRELRPLAPAVRTIVLSPPSLGRVILPENSQRTIVLEVLGTPAAADMTTIVISSNPAVADIGANPVVLQNEQTVALTIDTGSQGTAELILRAGQEVRRLQVTVGIPPSGTEPPMVAASVGVLIPETPSIGQVRLPVASAWDISVLLLDAPAPTEVEVSVTSGDPSVADVTEPVVIPYGGRSAILSLETSVEGTAVLILSTDDLVRELTVNVGLPAAEIAPPTVARPVGIRLLPLPSAGRVILPEADGAQVTVRLLDQPAESEVSVIFASADPDVAEVLESQVGIPVDEVSATFTLISGDAGETTIWINFGDETHELHVRVGDFATDELAPTLAPPIGVEVE